MGISGILGFLAVNFAPRFQGGTQIKCEFGAFCCCYYFSFSSWNINLKEKENCIELRGPKKQKFPLKKRLRKFVAVELYFSLSVMKIKGKQKNSRSIVPTGITISLINTLSPCSLPSPPPQK